MKPTGEKLPASAISEYLVGCLDFDQCSSFHDALRNEGYTFKALSELIALTKNLPGKIMECPSHTFLSRGSFVDEFASNRANPKSQRHRILAFHSRNATWTDPTSSSTEMGSIFNGSTCDVSQCISLGRSSATKVERSRWACDESSHPFLFSNVSFAMPSRNDDRSLYGTKSIHGSPFPCKTTRP